MRAVRPHVMIRIFPGDLVAVRAKGKYYYALVLDRVRLFGGNWVYVFHKTSRSLIAADELLATKQPGFHAFVDFIRAKRENRLTRIAKNVSQKPYDSVRYLKVTPTRVGKPKWWFILDMKFRELKKVRKLTKVERKYPLSGCIDVALMVTSVDHEWLPERCSYF